VARGAVLDASQQERAAKHAIGIGDERDRRRLDILGFWRLMYSRPPNPETSGEDRAILVIAGTVICLCLFGARR
jgi:hypothetical protein